MREWHVLIRIRLWIGLLLRAGSILAVLSCFVLGGLIKVGQDAVNNG